MSTFLSTVIDLNRYPLNDEDFQQKCKRTLDETGVLVISDFLNEDAIQSVQQEGVKNQNLAYYTANKHNIYLSPSDSSFPSDHPRNREINSTKGCITTDQIPSESILHSIYAAAIFRDFLCAVLGEVALYEYADNLSSINLHYASEGQELGWHFDNSSFAITLMVQSANTGGAFEYVKDVRDADNGEMNYELAGDILDQKVPTQSLEINAGDLVLFRGRNSMHRVTPVVGSRTRMMVVLAYNTEPNISLSESARMTFFGRLG